MASQGVGKEGEEPFYLDSESSDEQLPNVQISNPTILMNDSERDLGTGGFRNARFKRDKKKYESSNSLLHEDRSTSFSTTASVEFDSEENISNKPEELFWLRHPRVRENCKTVAAAFLLFFAGFVFLIAGIALAGLNDNEENSHKAIIFFVCAAICIIPGGYHIIYIYRATRGERGYNFESIPSFK